MATAHPSYVMTAILFVIAGCDMDTPIEPEVDEPFSIVEASIPDMQNAMNEGRQSAQEHLPRYMTRLALNQNQLNATISVNPNAMAEAELLDRERAQGRVRGPLHGIPIALKDNIHTTNMPTTGGSLAFEGLTPPYDATLTIRRREAGAIIIAKTVLTELANWVAGAPFDMPDNYSSLGGYGFNPYAPRRAPRPGIGAGMPVPDSYTHQTLPTSDLE